MIRKAFILSSKICLILLLIASTSCEYPRDPENTLNHVRGGTLIVGISENEPWTKKVNGSPSGIEVQLVQQLADELNTKIIWRWGLLEENLLALENYELDLVIAGMTKATPWRTKVGLTKPYYSNDFVVGVPRGTEHLNAIKGKTVAFKDGSNVLIYLKDKNAKPLPLRNPFTYKGPVAAPRWQLKKRGFKPTNILLHTDEHVLAVPPGENAWLTEIDRFLHKNSPGIDDRLSEEITNED
ncbi:MAG: transporter substrate-binding domain-containing protein [Deltaproteobacteria bacterium]